VAGGRRSESTPGAGNERLFDAFVQADLPRRVGFHMRNSIMLYDRDFRLCFAMNGPLPSERTLRELYHRTLVRYWSKGV
jgi:hypothetical protein